MIAPQHVLVEMDTSDDGVDLVDAVFLYLTQKKYPSQCSNDRKRAIRRKAMVFVLHDGVLFFKKKKKKGEVCVLCAVMITHTYTLNHTPVCVFVTVCVELTNAQSCIS